MTLTRVDLWFGGCWEKMGSLGGCLGILLLHWGQGHCSSRWYMCLDYLQRGIRRGQDKIAPSRAFLALSSDGFTQAFLHLPRLG